MYVSHGSKNEILTAWTTGYSLEDAIALEDRGVLGKFEAVGSLEALLEKGNNRKCICYSIKNCSSSQSQLNRTLQ